MVSIQFKAFLYWPGVEFMYLVFTTSTGEATTVAQNPAPKAATKWQGKVSGGGIWVMGFGVVEFSIANGMISPLRATCN